MADWQAARQYAAEAMRLSSPEDAPIRSLAWLAQANLGRSLGNFKEAIPAYLEALPIMPSTGAFSGTCNLIVAFGQVYLVQGQLAAAEDLYRSSLAQAAAAGRGSTPAIGILQCGLAEVLYERDQLDEARALFAESEANSRRCGMIDLLTGLAILGARLDRQSGDLPGAIARLVEAQSLARPGDSPNLSAEIGAWLAAFQAEAGDLSAAAAWAARVRPCPESNPGFTHGIELLALGRVLICQGKLDEALRLAEKLEALAADGESLARLAAAQLIQAEILWTREQRSAALSRLGESLALAESCGFRRLFLGEGPRLVPLFLEWKSAQPSAEHRDLAAWLLERIRQESRQPSEGATAPARAATDLTGRELDVLRCLVEGLTYPEIARKLVISAGTVKTHASHIYAKLGVAGRVEAIRRAQELKLA